ncbi:hypothetical protein PPACK8108_LOCUS16138 [Phakopsora pachyrhizi]|uniref:Uncharacterized protein n=1 Tax=Phakopsora pachyrhizi TaxID=170000 RepID=A0AAV0B9Q3_PHAPC|nr:hypothetical protein PPACK8108_LOCUS16138 [Phakopsora pachyrhizi]
MKTLVVGVSNRAIEALVPPTSKLTGQLRREAHIGPLPQFPGESFKNLIALRFAANDRVSIYYLTKQEVPVVLHKRSAKKGKGKEKGKATVTYLLVGLLAFLDPGLSLHFLKKLMRSSPRQPEHQVQGRFFDLFPKSLHKL